MRKLQKKKTFWLKSSEKLFKDLKRRKWQVELENMLKIPLNQPLYVAKKSEFKLP